jgi:ATP-dependent Clp protease ATP-binding subunit ClpA
VFERFARSARAAVEGARDEAARRGDRRIGSEHLLIAVLADDDLADQVGIDAERAKSAADRLDQTALAAIGLELGDFHPTPHPAPLGNATYMTTGAKAVIRQSLAKAAAEKSRTITTRHMLLALLERDAPDPAAALFAELDVTPEDLRARLRRPEARTA